MQLLSRARLSRLSRLVIDVGRRLDRDGALNMASSLSYTSLLSLVPLLAIGLALLAAFPVFDDVRGQLEGLVFRYVVPQAGQQVQDQLNTFVGNAGKLTAAGVVGLVVTSVTLLITIETSLNQIFRVAAPRSLLSRLALYWTALTLGPLLVGTSLSLSAWLFAVGDVVERWGLSLLTGAVATIAPTLLLMVAFGLLYLAVPNRRVRLADAVIGGVAAGLAFAVLRWGFGVYVGVARPYQSIYGAVAIVPLFLFWMYLSWVVVLFGAELAATLPEWRAGREVGAGWPSARRRLAAALAMLGLLREEARGAGKGRRRGELLDAAGSECAAGMLDVLDRCTLVGLIVPTAGGRFVLGRDPAQVRLSDLARALEVGLEADGVAEAAEPRGAFEQRLAEAARAEARAFDVPLAEILDQLEEVPAGCGRRTSPARRSA